MILLAAVLAQALSVEPPPIFPCVVETVRVDDMPVVRHIYCTMVGSLVVPLGGPEAGERVFGIRRDDSRPVIQKDQRRLE